MCKSVDLKADGDTHTETLTCAFQRINDIVARWWPIRFNHMSASTGRRRCATKRFFGERVRQKSLAETELLRAHEPDSYVIHTHTCDPTALHLTIKRYILIGLCALAARESYSV